MALGNGNDNINIDGQTTTLVDFGGLDTYTVIPSMSADVTLTDVSGGIVNLPAGLDVTAASFLSNGVQFTVNGNILTILGDMSQFTFVFGGDPVFGGGTTLSFEDTAAAFGTTVPADGEAANDATNTGEINADGTVGDGGGGGTDDPTLTADQDSVDEGSTASFTLEDAAPDSTVSYTISGVDAADVVGGSLTGTVDTDSDGNATIEVEVAADETTEGEETLTVSIDGTDLEASTTVNDTSLTPEIELTADADSADEGTTASFSITNGEPNTEYTFGISGVDAADVLGGVLIDSVTTDADGNATIFVELAADRTTEGEETLTVSILNTPLTASTTVNDTSLDNVAPVAEDEAVEVGEADAAVSGQLDATDVEGDALTFAVDTPVDGLTVNPDGSYTFDPAANPAAQALTYVDDPLVIETTYSVTDALGAVSETKTISITVTPTPLSFELTPLAAIVEESDTQTFTLTASEALAEDTDVTFNLLPGDGVAVDAGTSDTNTNDFGPGAFNPVTETIATGATEATFDVTPVADNLAELPENFSVTATIDGEVVGEETGLVLDDTTVNTDPGQIFTLTTDTDNPSNLVGVPGTGDPVGNVFNAPLETGLGGLLGVQTLQGPDVLIGSDEVDDTLNAVVNGTGAGAPRANPALSGIEIFNLTSVGGLAAFINTPGLDLINSTGFQQLWNIGSNNNLRIDNVGENAAIGLQNVAGGTVYNVNYAPSADTATQTVIADNVGAPGNAAGTGLAITAPGGIGTMDLIVQNGVDLNLVTMGTAPLDMGVTPANLNITGTGPLNLTADNTFAGLNSLDSSGYDGGLGTQAGQAGFDISGSEVLTSVVTDGADDHIIIDNTPVNGGLSVDLGSGDANILEIQSDAMPFTDANINALNFTGGVTNVENIAIGTATTLGGAATFDLDGVSTDLDAVWFFANINGAGNKLSFANEPNPDLTLNVLDAQNLELHFGNTVNLDVNAFGTGAMEGDLDIDNVGGDMLETVDADAVNQLRLDITSNPMNDVTMLQSVTGTGNNADVDLTEANGGDDFDALTDVTVNGAVDAELTMTGLGGTPEVTPLQEIVEIQLDGILAENTGNFAGFDPYEVEGSIALAGPDLPGGALAFDFDIVLNLNPFGPNPATLDFDPVVADQLATFLNGQSGLSATATGLFNPNVTLTFLDEEDKDDITVFAPGTGQDVGDLGGPFDENNVSINKIQDGRAAEDAIIGEGFDGLETVDVDAGTGNANVDLDDVYGSFTLDVLAGSNATVNLNETGVTGDAVVSAGLNADIDIAGPIFGNPNLMSLTVEADTAQVDLSHDLSSFMELDLTGIDTSFLVNTGLAEFMPGDGQSISYLIGDTESDNNADEGQINMNAARETVTLTESELGTLVLDSFTTGADPLTGDRLDMSELGFTNNGQLLFEVGTYDGIDFTVGGGVDVRVTDLAGGPDFTGEVVLLGITDATDLTQFNMVYA